MATKSSYTTRWDTILAGFTVETDPRALGYAIQALVHIRPLPGKLHLVEKLIQETPEIVECDRITGEDPFLARRVVRSVEEMDAVLEGLSDHAVTSTAVIKGQSVKRRLPPLWSVCKLWRNGRRTSFPEMDEPLACCSRSTLAKVIAVTLSPEERACPLQTICPASSPLFPV
ncbi:Lrp/AsnC family transcriptional regulator [Rhizobium quercicola]|uniref:Lrp/AsnC family transcriptional regulator n=1 Tax=Rhizobium quercicola TaxID=2901226 RepID=UPI003B849D1F